MAFAGLPLPGKIIAVGLNYRSHAAELGMAEPDEPLLFLKPPSAVIGPGDAIILPPQSERVDYEAELAVVIGRQIHRTGTAEAEAAIAGYACANDVTARDLQERDGQWTRAKSFDTFCPLGPGIISEPPPPGALVQLLLNGEVRQQAPLDDMVFSPVELVSFISGVMTLMPGDVILTGTPPGVGSLRSGDEVTVRVEGVGELTNSVRAAGQGLSGADVEDG